MVFDESAYYTRRAFRPQSQLPAAPVLKGVHLFFDDVGSFPHGALEQLDGLKRGGTDLLKAELLKQSAGPGFQVLKPGGFFGKNVMRAADRLKFRTHFVNELYDTYVY